MPTRGEQPILDLTFTAEGAISKYAVVIFGAVEDGVKLPAAARDAAIAGVAQEASTASGDIIKVRRAGRSYVTGGASGTVGATIAIHDVAGRVSTPAGWASGDGYVGYYEEAPSASGDQVIAFINPGEFVR